MIALDGVLPDFDRRLDPLAERAQSRHDAAGRRQVELVDPLRLGLVPTGQLFSVGFAVELLAAVAQTALRRHQDVPAHAVHGIILQHLARVGFDEIEIARRVQADRAFRRANALGVRLAVDEIASQVFADEFPVPVQCDVAERGDLALVQFCDGLAEPVALHAGELCAHARLVRAVAVMRHGHDHRAVHVRPPAELRQRDRVRLAEEFRQLVRPQRDPAPVNVELSETMRRPLRLVVAHTLERREPLVGDPRRRHQQNRPAQPRSYQVRLHVLLCVQTQPATARRSRAIRKSWSAPHPR